MNDRFLKACRRQPVDCTPIWFMRQAGRYMSEYQAIRAKHSLIDICHQPELACEVTLQPIRRLDVDAAILFSDLLLPLVPMGLNLEFHPGKGPIIDNPIRSVDDVDSLREFDVSEGLGFTMRAIELLKKELDVPLIAFAGAPFTMASYAIEGGASRHFDKTKTFMYRSPEAWHRLAGRLTASVGDYLLAQASAGADALQVFDSWIGALSPGDYRQFVLPHVSALFERLEAAAVPLIHFGTGTAGKLDLIRQAGGDVIGLDWRIDLDRGWQSVGYDVAVQGNLDPLLLYADESVLHEQAQAILDQARGRAGHIFNLGHGILPETPVERVAGLVDYVRERSARRA